MKLFTIILVTLVAMPSFMVAGSASAPALAPTEDPKEDLHYVMPDPVGVSLAASPAPGLDRPFTLTATLVANWQDLPGTSITLALPDGIERVGDTRGTIDLAFGEPATMTFTLVPTAMGTHEIRLLASADVEGATLGGSRVGFVVVDETGMGAFYQDMVPRASRLQVDAPVRAAAPAKALADAPVTLERGTAPDAADPPVLPETAPHRALESGGESAGARDGISTLASSTFQVKVCWYYESEAATPVDTPQRFTTVQVWDEDDISDDKLAEGVTGSDGCYTSPPIGREDTDGGAGNQDMFVRIHLCNTWVCVEDSDEDFYVYRVDYGDVGDADFIDLGGYKAPSGDQIGSRAFQYANNAGYFAANYLQAGITSGGPQVTLWAPSQDSNCPGMFLRRSENRIHVCSDSDRSPEDVGHEFGHWTQWNLYGQSFWPSPGGPHNLCTDSENRGLAWTEGWGNFFGPRVGREVVAPGADNNQNYDRPWDGSSFSISMETTYCTQSGDDNEMRVAQSLWDIRDTSVDGVDTGFASNSFIASVVNNCDSNNFREFFDGNSCNWISQGGDPCTFMRAAYQNNVDFDDHIPYVAITSQGSFQWLRGTAYMSATASDSDQGCTPSVEFRVSHDSTCNASDTWVDSDPSSPYLVSFDTTTFTDDGSVWACAESSDGLKKSGWAVTGQFGIDNTRPTLGASFGGTSGNDGWWRSAVGVTLGCTDALSGVDTIQYSVDLGSLASYTGTFSVSDEGAHFVFYECADHAGNVDYGGTWLYIDTRAPSTTTNVTGPMGEHGWYVGDATVSFACADPTPGSGCDATHATLDAATFDYSAPFTVTGDAIHHVGYASEDVAGNLEGAGSFSVPIDTTPPTGAITSATDGAFTYDATYVAGGLFTNSGSINVSYHAADATSGLQWVSAVGDTDTYAGVLAINGTLTLTLPAGISTWTITAKDMAGHTATIGTFSVVSIPPGTFAGGIDPRTSGWWKNAVKSGAYTQAQLDAMLPLINVASHSFGGPDNHYAELNASNLYTVLQSNPPTADERAEKELAAAWLNLVSGREPAAKAVDLSSVTGWQLVVRNTGVSSTTSALNVIAQAEKRLTESPDTSLLNAVKNVLSALNSGSLNA